MKKKDVITLENLEEQVDSVTSYRTVNREYKRFYVQRGEMPACEVFYQDKESGIWTGNPQAYEKALGYTSF